MPNSPEGIAAILDQLSRVSNDLGRYAIALESNTQAVSELREELREVKEQLNKDAVLRAKEEGRAEAEREAKRKHRDDDSGTFPKPREGRMILNFTIKEILLLAAGIGGLLKGFWKDIAEAMSGK